jgi:Microtubule binding
VQELKGNIRVFCRVRPAAESENGETACEVPASSEGAPSSRFPWLQQHNDAHCSKPAQPKLAEVHAAGRALNLMVPAGDRPGNSERYSFAFDRVFGPAASQVNICVLLH